MDKKSLKSSENRRYRSSQKECLIGWETCNYTWRQGFNYWII